MLNLLHIENIAVIEKTDISFGPGLNVLTGETGAGKSIIIDSLGFLLGNRADRDLIRNGAPYALVSAEISDELASRWLSDNDIDSDDGIIIQRRLNPDGRSSARVCGVPVTATQLKELGEIIVDIYGQNDGRQLLDEKKHIKYLDSYADSEALLSQYRAEYKKYRDIISEIKNLSQLNADRERLYDDLSYRIRELEKAELKSGEYDSITERIDLLRNSEKLTEALNAASAALSDSESGALSACSNAEYFASKACNITGDVSKALEDIRNAESLLSDANEILSDYLDALEFSPGEYDMLESRLSSLNRLRRKYNRDEDGLIEYLSECRVKLSQLDDTDERLNRLEAELKKQKKICLDYCGRITDIRKRSASVLSAEITGELRDLSMPSAVFEVEITPLENGRDFDKDGADTVRFKISANAGEKPGPVNKIASGGELSRIMLGMKNVFSRRETNGTIIFDEIDTGVSGIAAQRVAEKLYSVSSGKQVLCVSHLPQIASMADTQFYIHKSEENGKTRTMVDELDFSGRMSEIARLYGGANITELTLNAAGEQLLYAGEYKKKINNS